MLFFRVLAVTCVHYSSLIVAARSILRPSTMNPSRIPPLNLTNEPQIFCDRLPVRKLLSHDQIRECKSAVAFLPLPYTDVKKFGPDESEWAYRTPISSTHSTRCEATVTMVGGFSSDKASWRDVRDGAWDVIATCLRDKGRVGYAKVGERYGIKVGIKYRFG